MEELLELDFVLDPTLTIYEASRDVMRAREAEWHDRYTLPSLHGLLHAPAGPATAATGSAGPRPTRSSGSNNFRIWMRFLNEYKNRGGRVTTGSDSGFIYKLYGFGYIRELELLQEAGFHPLEVVRSATLWGARRR
jgi:hypothetical protein